MNEQLLYYIVMMQKVSNVYSKEIKEKHRCRPRAALALAVAQGIARFYYLRKLLCHAL
jgi:hypothetical protein